MTNTETATLIREWIAKDKMGEMSIWSWPTDGAGYDQHIRFAEYRNKNWKIDYEFYDPAAWWQFCEKYADLLGADLLEEAKEENSI